MKTPQRPCSLRSARCDNGLSRSTDGNSDHSPPTALKDFGSRAQTHADDRKPTPTPPDPTTHQTDRPSDCKATNRQTNLVRPWLRHESGARCQQWRAVKDCAQSHPTPATPVHGPCTLQAVCMTTRLPGYSPYVHTKHRLTTSLLLSTSTCRTLPTGTTMASRPVSSGPGSSNASSVDLPPLTGINRHGALPEEWTLPHEWKMESENRLRQNWKMDVQNQIAHIAQTLDASLRHYPHPEVGRRFDYADKVQEAEREKRKYLSDPERATAHAQDFSRTSHARRQF
ncbi:hypothetical protein C0Q70_02176 [Pomacea canaliculata]|uniref:Uncharacterized protein n=1 Tax=Pomacea canaliculata TaxID=400727 RepID=A0A2T7Q1J0_POMCA|nr:hypothetical protein C0Q70_02176 [Pomacea canaliculata]